MNERISGLKENDLYFYNQPIEEIRGGAHVLVNGREMGMYASYSYLGLVGHPRINAAAKKAIDHFGTGTHGVRTLAGTLTVHQNWRRPLQISSIAKRSHLHIRVMSPTCRVISTLMGRGDYVISDKLNHASIVDGCLTSGAEFLRASAITIWKPWSNVYSRCRMGSPSWSSADSVFSMDGDIIDLPRVVELARRMAPG